MPSSTWSGGGTATHRTHADRYPRPSPPSPPCCSRLTRGSDEALRHALYLWAFRNQSDPPEQAARILSWVAEHSLPLSALADDDIMLDVLAAIARKLDGSRAAANTISRKRAAARQRNC